MRGSWLASRSPPCCEAALECGSASSRLSAPQPTYVRATADALVNAAANAAVIAPAKAHDKARWKARRKAPSKACSKAHLKAQFKAQAKARSIARRSAPGFLPFDSCLAASDPRPRRSSFIAHRFALSALSLAVCLLVSSVVSFGVCWPVSRATSARASAPV